MHKERAGKLETSPQFFLQTIPELQTLMSRIFRKNILAKQVGTRSKGIPGTYGDFDQLLISVEGAFNFENDFFKK